MVEIVSSKRVDRAQSYDVQSFAVAAVCIQNVIRFVVAYKRTSGAILLAFGLDNFRDDIMMFRLCEHSSFRGNAIHARIVPTD